MSICVSAAIAFVPPAFINMYHTVRIKLLSGYSVVEAHKQLKKLLTSIKPCNITLIHITYGLLNTVKPVKLTTSAT